MIIVADFKMGNTAREKISKEVETLNNTIDHLDFPKHSTQQQQCPLFSLTQQSDPRLLSNCSQS